MTERDLNGYSFSAATGLANGLGRSSSQLQFQRVRDRALRSTEKGSTFSGQRG